MIAWFRKKLCCVIAGLCFSTSCEYSDVKVQPFRKFREYTAGLVGYSAKSLLLIKLK